jgi:hypothetical protein
VDAAPSSICVKGAMSAIASAGPRSAVGNRTWMTDVGHEYYEPRSIRRTGRRSMKASGCASVLMNQTAQDVNAFNPINNRQGGHRRHRGGHRDVQADTAMRPAAVVVLKIAGEDSLQVATVPKPTSSPDTRIGPCAPTARHTRSPSASAAGS